MALEFETLTPASKFGRDCDTAILDLRPLIPDTVLRGIPRFFGRWEDSTTMDIMLSKTYSVAAGATDCDYDIATAATHMCSVILPNQTLIPIGMPSSDMVYTHVMKRFCNAKGLTRYPTLFLPDGSFDMGNPLSETFLIYLLYELRYPMMSSLREYAWTGDQASGTTKEFSGIITQLDAGQTPAGDGCDPYQHVEFDWDALTENAGDTAPVDDTISAGNDSVVIHNQTFTGMEGLDLLDFMKLWIERLYEWELSAWADDVIELEMWLPRGSTNCIASLAACMQPCVGCVDPMSDPQIRDRAAEFQRDRVIWLYPYDDVKITLKTTPALTNEIILLPKSVSGRPTLAWVFRDQIEQQAILDGELPWFGTDPGASDPTDVYPADEVVDAEGDSFTQRAFTLNLSRNTNCIEAWLNVECAMVLMGVHTWIRFTNVECSTLTPNIGPGGAQQTAYPITVCATGTATQLDLTLPVGTSIADDTLVAVYFSDGITVLTGSVVSSVTVVHLIEFTPTTVDCTTGGGAVGGSLLVVE